MTWQQELKAHVDAAVAAERERCAKIADSVAEHYDEYAAKYDDDDGRRAEIQARTCRSLATSIRNL